MAVLLATRIPARALCCCAPALFSGDRDIYTDQPPAFFLPHVLPYLGRRFALWATYFYFPYASSWPPRDPLIGNLRQMPSQEAPLVFHEWAKKYGDVLYLQVPGQSDLLDKRGAIYSDRPKFLLYELFGWTSSLTGLPYGKKLAKHRQMHQSYLSRQNCSDYMPMQVEEARALVYNLLNSEPARYETCLSRFATGLITQIVAGHKIESDDDPYLRIAKAGLESMSRAGGAPGVLLSIFSHSVIQYFPRWFPGTHYAAVADRWRPTVRELYEHSVRSVRDKRVSSRIRDAAPSFILSQLEEMETWNSRASMFAAGESTTWSALSVFMLAMVLHPECQVKAQEELDRVLGGARLPEFEDRSSLPYVECVYHEIFRWAPGVPLGVPHRLMQDDSYRGMFIPAGSIVFANIKYVHVTLRLI
ncbi:cytochrome P450 [Mycena leptocephala]|nr:cytochrome P450 [Mycena leptocephala]